MRLVLEQLYQFIFSSGKRIDKNNEIVSYTSKENSFSKQMKIPY